jgi:hypothetical protein
MEEEPAIVVVMQDGAHIFDFLFCTCGIFGAVCRSIVCRVASKLGPHGLGRP